MGRNLPLRLVGWVILGAMPFWMAACAPRGEAGNGDHREDHRSETTRLLAKLKAMDGRSGEFEGLYIPGLLEGSSFEFCTKDECPDVREMDCNPAFDENALSVLRPLWDQHDGKSIHMFAIGTLHTLGKDGKPSGYGHMDGQLCEIAISHVRQPRIVDAEVVRSKQFPDLAKPPR